MYGELQKFLSRLVVVQVKSSPMLVATLAIVLGSKAIQQVLD
jgi:hypothetical protein